MKARESTRDALKLNAIFLMLLLILVLIKYNIVTNSIYTLLQLLVPSYLN